MKIATTGSIIYGICSEKTHNCSAINGGPVTTILLPPNRAQRNVCRACLDQRLREGTWQIEGAAVKGMRRVYDICIFYPRNKIFAIFELKYRFETTVEWAIRLHSDLSRRGRLSDSSFFCLLTPENLSLWDQRIINKEYSSPTLFHSFMKWENSPGPESLPLITNPIPSDFNQDNYFEVRNHFLFEKSVVKWLTKLKTGHVAQDDWLVDELNRVGFYQGLKEGKIEQQVIHPNTL